MTFDKCVERDAAEDCRTPRFKQIAYFCGQHAFCLTPSQKSLNQAKQNMIKHYPLIGYLENIDEFLEASEMLWPQFFKDGLKMYYKLINSHGYFKPYSTPKPSEKTKTIMMAKLKFEYEFYNFVKQRFNCTYKLLTKR